MANKYKATAHIIVDASYGNEFKLNEVAVSAEFPEFTYIREVFETFARQLEDDESLKSITLEIEP